MSSHGGLHLFDDHVQTGNIWVHDLAARLMVDDPRLALAALRACLHVLRDRIPPATAAHFAAQLPTLVRGIFYEGWTLSAGPPRDRHCDDFLAHLSREMRHPDLDPRRTLETVLGFLADQVGEPSVSKIKSCLPTEIRRLWPEEGRRTH